MKTYLIGYDLNKEGQNYASLIKRLEVLFPTYWRHLDSTWIVKTTFTAVEIRDDLRKHIDSNDELLVVGLTGVGAWTGFNTKGSEWLKNNL